jgi:DNA-binding transcriptional MerR regulator
MKPRDKGIPLDEVLAIFKKTGQTLSKQLVIEWETTFPMFKPIKHSNGARFYTVENVELLELIVDLIKVKGCSVSYALTAIKKSKSHFLQKRRAIVHLEVIKKQLEDWRASI